MKIKLNQKQREKIASFLMDVSVAWFVGLFVVPSLPETFNALIFCKYLVNMIGTFFFSLWVLKE
jgi:hypothetical protein